MSQKFFQFGVLALLAVIAVREYSTPVPALAQATEPAFYFEPGTHSILTPDGGSTQGKIVVDLTNGDVWGFPTYGKLPYPGPQLSEGRQQTSNGVYLGRFNINARKTSRRP